ncbi:helix-turn-helix domain-containing protein [Streptomyces sp. NPDC001220]
MSRHGKALPVELEPCLRQLIVRLRRLKERSGLSLHRLASHTGYSPKSWERYLAGRSLPPPEAVAALARLGGGDPVGLLALHEVAARGGDAEAVPAALRALRDRTGLSLAGLAAKTTFSKSSWQRYLGGRALPPRAAVEQLCALAGEPAGRCLALREVVAAQGYGGG